MSQSFPDVTILDAKRANKEVQRLKETPLDFRIFPIPLEERMTVLINDSAFDTSGRERSQTGWVIGCAYTHLHHNKR